MKGLASAKYHLYDINGSNNAYNEALILSGKTGDISTQMEILQDLWYQNTVVGDLEQARLYASDMDSLMEITSDSLAKFTYYNKKERKQETMVYIISPSNGFEGNSDCRK